MTQPGAPRDLDLEQWLDGIAFHPADTEAKQLGHEMARQAVAWLGRSLHSLLPPGRDKSLTFTALEDVLMRANKALALGDGPREHNTADDLRAAIDGLADLAAAYGYPMPEDPRVDAYKAEQRGEVPGQATLPEGTEIPTTWSQVGGHEYDGTVATDDEQIKIELHASVASARVQIGVLCTSSQRVEEQFTSSGESNGTSFNGFYAGFTTPDHLSAFLREAAAAGQVAFGQTG
jgi:hypothetical protein